VIIPAQAPVLVATDLDGTLLRPDGSVSARTERALAALAAIGVEIVLVTARPPRWVDPLAPIAGPHATVICANGAFVYDVASRVILQSRTLPPETVGAIAADLRRLVPGVGLAAEHAGGFHAEPGYPGLHPVPPDATCGPVEDLGRPVGKLLARSLALPQEEFLARAAAIVGSRGQVSSSGAEGLAEIGPLGVTKASALTAWCAARKITSSQVWAFGDMPNDLPMLAWAGASFAVANAHPDVRAVAGYRCPSNADDGVAQVLEALVSSRGAAPRP
jgi:hydroxymethylpyrimidine pyrophosphatase-like HAD family hydrolase